MSAEQNILDEAKGLVYGDRHDAYGHPYDDFARTGKIWAAILGLDEVTPEQVALCQIAIKISRQCNQPKRDNAVDIAGYADCLQRVVEERGRREPPEPRLIAHPYRCQDCGRTYPWTAPEGTAKPLTLYCHDNHHCTGLMLPVEEGDQDG